jgi:hypothetical protein
LAARRLRHRRHPADQVLDEILEDRRIELVVDLLAAPFGDNEAAGAKHGEVARDGRPAGMKLRGDLAGRARAGAQELENVAAGFIGQRAEGGVFGRDRPCMISTVAK